MGTLQYDGDGLPPGYPGAAFQFRQAEIWSSDEGAQFTAADFTAPLRQREFRRAWMAVAVPRRLDTATMTDRYLAVIDSVLQLARPTGNGQRINPDA